MWSVAKISSAFILFAVSFFGGIASGAMVRCMESKLGVTSRFTRIVSLLNCFAGGVFFSTCVLDILPEARESMAVAKEKWGLDSEYPLTELLLGLGFLVVMVIEHVAHACCFNVPLPETMEGEKNITVESKITVDQNDAKQTNIVGVETDKASKRVSSINGKLETTPTPDSKSITPYSPNVPDRQEATKSAPMQCSDCANGDYIATIVLEEKDKDVEGRGQEESSNHGTIPDSKQTYIRGVLLLSILTLHSTFDGLALGLLTDVTSIWSLLLALSVHKALVFFQMGLHALHLLQSFNKTAFIIFVLSLFSPIGIAIGVTIGNGQTMTEASMSAILQGIAAGTFIYVTFFEILLREFDGDRHDLVKVGVVVLGFLTIAASVLI